MEKDNECKELIQKINMAVHGVTYSFPDEESLLLLATAMAVDEELSGLLQQLSDLCH